MYKFVIKGIDGVIKYTSSTLVSTVDVAQNAGSRFKLLFIMYNMHNIIKSDIVEVIPVNQSITELNKQQYHLLVQQY